MTHMDWFGLSTAVILSIVALIDLWRTDTSLRSKLLTSLLLIIPIFGAFMYLLLRPDIKNVRHTTKFNHYYNRGDYFPHSVMKKELSFAIENAGKISKSIGIGLSIWPNRKGKAKLIAKNVTSEDIDKAFKVLFWDDTCFVTLVKRNDLWLQVSGNHGTGFNAMLVVNDNETFIDPPPSSLKELTELMLAFNSDCKRFVSKALNNNN